MVVKGKSGIISPKLDETQDSFPQSLNYEAIIQSKFANGQDPLSSDIITDNLSTVKQNTLTIQQISQNEINQKK